MDARLGAASGSGTYAYLQNVGDDPAKLYVEQLGRHVEVGAGWTLALIFKDGVLVGFEILKAVPDREGA
ncbi:MAG: hypothetical protein FJ280_21380 [Planctomycetes bacterium]|nr:hypothetical protein [Planctomycetota bacterium]